MLVTIESHRLAEVHDNFLVILRILISEGSGTHMENLVGIRAKSNVRDLRAKNNERNKGKRDEFFKYFFFKAVKNVWWRT